MSIVRSGHMLIDGREYPVPDDLSLGELRIFKQIGGLRPGELEAALAVGDPDVILAFCLIAKQRAGERVTLADVERIRNVEFAEPGDEDGDDDDPPAGQATGSDEPGGDGGKSGSRATTRGKSGRRS